MDDSIGFNPNGSYRGRCSGIRFVKTHESRFFKGKERDFNTGEILDDKLFINGTFAGGDRPGAPPVIKRCRCHVFLSPVCFFVQLSA